jgi:hypothetical protein
MAASKKELALTLEQVNEVLELRLPEYVFYWRVSTGRRVKAGGKAGTLMPDGYTVITINGNSFRAHRLVWFITYGEFPSNFIDHIDGNPPNNRIENLRDVTNKINGQNRKKRERREADLPTGVKAQRNNHDEIRGYYTHWSDMDGKGCQVYFGIKKYYTLEAALAAATTRRELERSKLIIQGAHYTERHGV